jgi:hypothetical protein
MRIHKYAPLTLVGRFLPDDGSPASFIHHCYSREVWRRRGLWVGPDLLAAVFVWPLITLIAMGRSTRLHGRAIKARTGKGIIRQLLEQLRVALVYSILPRWYYVFELYHDERRQQASPYLQRFETKRGIYTMLKKKRDATVLESPLADKVAFALRCREHNVAAVPVIVALQQGAYPQVSGCEPTLPPIDLFVKPNYGKGGRGAERWDYQTSGMYRGSDGTVLTEAELLERLKMRFAEMGCLVQPRVVNHPLIADLSNGALTTVRLMSCRNEQEGFEITNAVFRMAQGRNTVVDNFHAGGLAAAVDLRCGELGWATDLGLHCASRWWDTHPDTNARIIGRRLPFWYETLALVQRAHAAFADRILVGWDVALLQDGPQLVEGNGAPDLDIIQRTHQVPLGNARLGQLLAFHLKQGLCVREC